MINFRMAKGGIEAPTEAEIKELSEIVIPEKPSREEERLLGRCFDRNSVREPPLDISKMIL